MAKQLQYRPGRLCEGETVHPPPPPGPPYWAPPGPAPGQPPQQQGPGRGVWILGTVIAVLSVITVVLVLAVLNRTGGGPITELSEDLLVDASAFPDSDGATVEGPTVKPFEPLQEQDVVSDPPECLDLLHPRATQAAGISQQAADTRSVRVSLRTVDPEPDLPGLMEDCRSFDVEFGGLSSLTDTVALLSGSLGPGDVPFYLVRREVISEDTVTPMVMRLGYFRGLYVEVAVDYDDRTEPTDTDIEIVNRLFDEQIALLADA